MEDISKQIESVIKIVETTDPVIAGGAIAAFYLRDVISEVIKRTTYPSADLVGNLFGKIIEHGTFQSPYSRKAASKVVRAIFDVAERLKNVKSDDFVEVVSPEIAVPIFNKLTYFEDNELRELLTSLLASSMLKDGQVHPAIVSSVDRLTSGEAKILKYYSGLPLYGPWPCITIKAATEKRKDDYIIPSRNELKELPEKDINDTYDLLVNKGYQNGFKDIGAQNLGTMHASKFFPNKEDAFFYVTNLRALGLIETTSGYIEDKKIYIDLVSDAYSYLEQARKLTNHEPIIEVSKLSITSLGAKTIEAFQSV